MQWGNSQTVTMKQNFASRAPLLAAAAEPRLFWMKGMGLTLRKQREGLKGEDEDGPLSLFRL